MIRTLFTLLRNATVAMFGSRIARRQAQHALVSAFANKFGMRLYSAYVIWPNDDDYQRAWKSFPETTGVVGDRKFFMYSAAKAIRQVSGDTAECGVFRGAGSHLMLESQAGLGKRHHVFDSFEGLSEPSSADDAATAATPQFRKHDFSATEAIVRQNLGRFENVFYYKGWIPQRFGEVADRHFSLVHLDVDLYEPTRDSLEFFYPRMTPGGFIISDDYGFTTAPGVTRAIDEFFANRPEKPIHLPTGQALIVRQRA